MLSWVAFRSLGSRPVYQQSEHLYETLQAAGIRSDLYQLEGADHADCLFVQPEVKALVADFLDGTLGNYALERSGAQPCATHG